MRSSKILPALVLATLTLHCSKDPSQPNDAGSSPDAATQADAASKVDATVGIDAHTPDTSDAEVVVSNDHTPVLSDVAARAAGRDGLTLQLEANVSDEDHDAVAVDMTFLDEVGRELEVYDDNADGHPDSGQLSLVLESEGPWSWIDTGNLVAMGVSTVTFVVRDQAGHASSPQAIPVTEQSVKTEGQSCDPTYFADRCEQGLGCRGSPTRCVAGSAPRITRFAYLSGDLNPRVLIEGEDVDDDATQVTLELLDQSGAPVEVDLDNDESPDAHTFEVVIPPTRNGKFFVELLPAATVADQVKKMAAVATDSLGHGSTRVVSSLSQPPLRSWGQSCSPRGFDTCPAGGVCTPGDPSLPNNCQRANALRTSACSTAPAVALGAEPERIFGRTSPRSLWDAAPGCAPHDPVSMPESIVKVVIETAAKLVVTTDLPGTNFDTVLYVLPSCEADGSLALACADDTATSPHASLETDELVAGEYYIVVDSWSSEGGSFELEVRTRN